MPRLTMTLRGSPPPAATLVFWDDPFAEAARALRGGGLHGAAVISDRRVAKLYGAGLAAALKKTRMPHLLLTFPPGDARKTRGTKQRIEDAMVRGGAGRDWAVMALGGGVTGDLAGFVAATYMRGITWFNIPTSLLAMVDASIGGKTSVNTPAGKNLVGAFHQPEAVFISDRFLETLPAAGWLDGTAEIVKHAAVMDAGFFTLLEGNLPLHAGMKRETLRRIIRRSAQIKLGIVEKDEREASIRSALNFGHTVGHALEALSGYRISHGAAVAEGMLVEAALSTRLGLLPTRGLKRLRGLLRSAGFRPRGRPLQAGRLMRLMETDKKKLSGRIRFVLLEDIGRVAAARGRFTIEVPARIVEEVLGSVAAEGAEP
jgi:3-dehydroquinate synthase